MDNIIYGIHPVLQALKQNKTIDKILLQKNISNANLKTIKDELNKTEDGIPVQYVPVEKLNSLTKGANHQGIVAFCSLVEYSDLDNLINSVTEQGKIPFLLFLDHITDVRNLGAIARTAECAGIDGIIIPDKGSAQINMDTVKTSAGAVLKIPVCKSNNTKSTLNLLHQNGIMIYAASEKANTGYTEVDMKQPLCLVMGAEDKGISKEALKMADNLISIPIKGETESLNVSVAAGIIIYEAVRQRNI